MKLGELLIHDKIISNAQLEDALQWQVLYNVRLGRALIEIGYVNENLVAQTLSRKLGVPAVGRNELLALDAQTISLISKEIATQYRAIPLGVSGRLLRVAMADPTDPQALDAIAQETGSIIQALVAPDLLICLALEKYYGFKCCKNSLPTLSASPAASRLPDPLAEQAIPLEPEDEGSDSYDSMADDDDYESGYADLPLESEANCSGVIELDPFSVCLASARSREEVADAVMQQIPDHFPAVALVIMRGNSAIGWRISISGRSNDCCAGAALPLGVSPVMRALGKGKPFNGLFQQIPDHARLYEALKLTDGSHISALPITMQKKTVAALMVWGREPDLTELEPELRRMVLKIALAFQMLIIRSKLLMT